MNGPDNVAGYTRRANRWVGPDNKFVSDKTVEDARRAREEAQYSSPEWVLKNFKFDYTFPPRPGTDISSTKSKQLTATAIDPKASIAERVRALQALSTAADMNFSQTLSSAARAGGNHSKVLEALSAMNSCRSTFGPGGRGIDFAKRYSIETVVTRRADYKGGRETDRFEGKAIDEGFDLDRTAEVAIASAGFAVLRGYGAPAAALEALKMVSTMARGNDWKLTVEKEALRASGAGKDSPLATQIHEAVYGPR